MGYGRFWVSFACILVSLALSISVFALSRDYQIYDLKFVRWTRDYRAYISIVVGLISVVLAKGQTYVAESLVVFATNFRLLSASSTKSPLTLDGLSLRKAMRERLLIFEWKNKWRSTLSIAWLLFWQVPAALWIGSITPTVRSFENPDVEVTVTVPNYTQTSEDFWGTLCVPAQACDNLLGITSDLGIFSYVTWKTRTGLLQNAVSHASSRNASTPKHQKLDSTGYVYLGRSYGVGASVGLKDPQVSDNNKLPGGTKDVSPDLIRSYFYLEDGYHANVSCQKNDSAQLHFSRLGGPLDYIPAQAYRASGSLPNGGWDGFPTWGVLNSGFVTALAAVIGQDRYMYGFLAGGAYKEMNKTQCEVTFTPARFNVSVDMGTKQVTVTPIALPKEIRQADIDIDPSRALTNISFLGASYISQTQTTLYTSVLGDAFKSNVGNIRTISSEASVQRN
ncbi:hypothetical protein ABW21_db0205737 [Orbilia brochopaga]|nr:hypothetical protein ABW21_db0205737 [Drechslerella brochopaga]